MKHYHLLIILLIISNPAISQNKTSSWSLEAGVNYVNVYSSGKDAPQGDLFDEFFNVNDHWNLGTYLSVTKTFHERFSFTLKGSFNELTKWGQTENEPNVSVSALEYYGVDGMINFKLLKGSKITPYIAAGGGYTWIEEGPYNTFSSRNGTKNLVGAGTLNAAFGLTFDLLESMRLNAQIAYKHSFEDYLTPHWQNSIGVVFDLGSKDSHEGDVIENSLNDSDSDGVPDAYDMCPDVSGLKSLGGCPDKNNDGIPDHFKIETGNGKAYDQGNSKKDDDYNESTSKNSSKENLEPSLPANESLSVYFESNSFKLDVNAKISLDAIVSLYHKKNGTSMVHIEGHTDNRGTREVNERLSMDRAVSVKKYLIEKGVDEDHVVIETFVDGKPKADNSTEEGRRLNRRAEISIQIKIKQ